MIEHGFIYFGPIQCSYCRMNVTLCDIEVHQIIPVISTIIACLPKKKYFKRHTFTKIQKQFVVMRGNHFLFFFSGRSNEFIYFSIFTHALSNCLSNSLYKYQRTDAFGKTNLCCTAGVLSSQHDSSSENHNSYRMQSINNKHVQSVRPRACALHKRDPSLESTD